MPWTRHLFTTAPMLIILSAIVGAAGILGFLAHPQAMMRTALINHPLAESSRTIHLDTVVEEVAHKVLASMAGDGPHDQAIAGPLGWTGPVNVGDRITIGQPQGGLRTLEVVEVRQLTNPIARASSDSDVGALTLVVSKIMGEPDAAKVRLIIETPHGGAPVGISDTARSL